MPHLIKQSDFREARDLLFCYQCGLPINSKSERHPDHIPPEAIFALDDRNFPLKVSSHKICNTNFSLNDKMIGQLISVIHGKHPKPGDNILHQTIYTVEGWNQPLLGFQNLDLARQIFRWVRGFHTALYHEYLPDQPVTKSVIHPSFPNGKFSEDGFMIDKILVQQPLFVEILKKNRLTKSYDSIECNNGKLKYECVWIQMDSGEWACVFGLQIYNWINLADKHFERRGCVGWYQPEMGCPSNGTKHTKLEFPYSNIDKLDPFGE